MTRHCMIAALAAALSPFAVSAGEISHTHVEAGVGRLRFDAPPGFRNSEFDGGYVRGSFELGRGFYAFGAHHRGELSDNFGFDIDQEETQVGIGYAHGMSATTDLVTELGYLGRGMGPGWDFDGTRASLGLRSQFGDRVEGWAKASYTDGHRADGDLSAQVGGLFRLTNTWGITGEVDADETANRYTLGVRASF